MLTTSVRAIGEIGAARADELGFQFIFAAHEELLHFLGRLVFVVFAQVAVAAGDGDFLRVGRDLLVHQFAVFVLAPLQALPGNDQRRVLLGLLAADQRLDRRMALDDAGQQRPLVHVVEHRRKLQRAGQVLDDFEVGRAVSSASSSWSSRMNSRSRLERFSLNWSRSIAVSMARKTSGPEDVGEGVVALLGQPEQQFAAGGVLADEPGERFLELADLAFLDQQVGEFAAELGGNGVQALAAALRASARDWPP